MRLLPRMTKYGNHGQWPDSHGPTQNQNWERQRPVEELTSHNVQDKCVLKNLKTLTDESLAGRWRSQF